MRKKKKKIRLDEILIKWGVITEKQIKEALARQKEHGGKFGSQLLFYRFISETDLVRALSKQFNCEGVVLSTLEIPRIVLKFIPARVAIARKIIPFDYDPEQNILKVACEDPTDVSLSNEINFVAREKKIKLYIATELVLDAIIAKYYLNRKTKLDNNLLIEIPDPKAEKDKISITSKDELMDDLDCETGSKSRVLLIIDKEYSRKNLKLLLEADNYQVTITSSVEKAIKIMEDNGFESVLIKDTVADNYNDLINRIRKISPGTHVRFFATASSLILEHSPESVENNLLIDNLDLFTSLLSSQEKIPHNHNGIVGKYVIKLCQRMGLSYKDHLPIVNAAYVHDLAKYYYTIDNPSDFRNTINLTVKLLQSINYSQEVIDILRSMYIDLKGQNTKQIPIEILGGNILGIVDLFCDNISINERLSLDKYDSIQKKLRALTNQLFFPDIVDAFVNIIKEEILQFHVQPDASQIMIFSKKPDNAGNIDTRLKNEGLRTIISGKVEDFIELYQRSQPDLIVLIPEGKPAEVIKFIENLSEKGIDFKQTPAFVMVHSSKTSQLTSIFKKGIEDIIAIDGSLDLFIAKINKIQQQQHIQNEKKSALNTNRAGTQGRLADMNLIDLIQALGPAQRTVKITARSASSKKKQLNLFLRQGKMIHAKLNELTGEDAIIEAIVWTDGIWAVEPINEDSLPDDNIQLTNEAILMKGCHQLDRKTKSNHTV